MAAVAGARRQPGRLLVGTRDAGRITAFPRQGCCARTGKGTLSLEEALSMIDRALSGFAPEPQTVPTRLAVGRVALEDQTSLLDLPPFDKSAVDGYAILGGDEGPEYRLIETVAAGAVGKAALRPGTTVKVMTGAAVPRGAGQVVMAEDASEEGDIVRIGRRSGSANICRKAEDVKKGDVIVRAGRRLSVADAANLISCGITSVMVARAPRVAVISTGDEIVDDVRCIKPGKIMNANGPMLAALVQANGLLCAGEATVPDSRKRTARAIERAAEKADIVVLSGGVSAGDFDYVTSAMEDVGLRVHFTGVAVKPGRPAVFATAPRKDGKVRLPAVFGLPGNPVSVFVTFHLYVLRAAAWLSGATPGLREFRLPLGCDFTRKKAERTEFVPCRLTEEGVVEAVEFHGSAHLRALSEADGFFVVPAGVSAVEAGEAVRFLPMTGCWP